MDFGSRKRCSFFAVSYLKYSCLLLEAAFQCLKAFGAVGGTLLAKMGLIYSVHHLEAVLLKRPLKPITLYHLGRLLCTCGGLVFTCCCSSAFSRLPPPSAAQSGVPGPWVTSAAFPFTVATVRWYGEIAFAVSLWCRCATYGLARPRWNPCLRRWAGNTPAQAWRVADERDDW